MKYLLILPALAALTLLGTAPVQAEVAVGDELPSFKMVGSDGKTYNSDDFKGKQAMVIAWFPKAFTGGCTKECQSLREHNEQLQAFDVAYFTASVDPAQKNKEFAESLDLDYPILSDPDKSVSKALGVLNDRGVTNRWTYYVGKDGKILYIDKSVKAAEHGQTIADKLAELGIPKK